METEALLIALYALAAVVVLILLTWVYAARCLALVPQRGYIAPCTVVNIHRFCYGPLATYRFELRFLNSLFAWAERDGYLISIDNGCPNCPRAYMRVGTQRATPS